MKGMIQDLINKRRREGANNLNSSDLLGAMMKVVDEETGKGIPDELLVGESLTFLFAGHDTTANLLGWSLYYLSGNTDIQEKLQKEVDEVFEGSSSPTIENISKLKYCRHILDETLRLRPSVPGFLDRITTTDVNICGVDLKKGSVVSPLFLSNHWDSRYWSDASSFKPERWEDSASEKKSLHPYVYLPFSAGSRNCIGMKFAVQEATIVLSMLMKQFSVSRDTSEKVRMVFLGTLCPINMKITFSKRNKA
jgi:cytochrome P450/NADPH-cytochrome P450 reductase